MMAKAPLRYLDAYLSPLRPFLARGEVTDLFINQPGEVWIETIGGGLERHALPDLDEDNLWRLARQVAGLAHQGINREYPLLAATLPDGARVQIVAPPATRSGFAVAIRKHVVPDLTLGDYLGDGAFDDVAFARGQPDRPPLANPTDHSPAALAAYLGDLVRGRRNVLISGGTSTGKTTFLNALIKEIPADERLLLIEDTAEVVMPAANSVSLLAVKGALGEARVTADDLLQAALRMRPDRIILGEVRGSEALTFLRAINTGHPGSLSTIHADSPAGAIEQLALIALQAGTRLTRQDIIAYVTNTIDAIVQLERHDGRRRIAQIMVTRS